MTRNAIAMVGTQVPTDARMKQKAGPGPAPISKSARARGISPPSHTYMGISRSMRPRRGQPAAVQPMADGLLRHQRGHHPGGQEVRQQRPHVGEELSGEPSPAASETPGEQQ